MSASARTAITLALTAAPTHSSRLHPSPGRPWAGRYVPGSALAGVRSPAADAGPRESRGPVRRMRRRVKRRCARRVEVRERGGGCACAGRQQSHSPPRAGRRRQAARGGAGYRGPDVQWQSMGCQRPGHRSVEVGRETASHTGPFLRWGRLSRARKEHAACLPSRLPPLPSVFAVASRLSLPRNSSRGPFCPLRPPEAVWKRRVKAAMPCFCSYIHPLPWHPSLPFAALPWIFTLAHPPCLHSINLILPPHDTRQHCSVQRY